MTTETTTSKITSRRPPIRYGIAVLLEVGEGIQLPIYDEIRARCLPWFQFFPAAEDAFVPASNLRFHRMGLTLSLLEW